MNDWWGNIQENIQNMHKLGCKTQLFKSAGFSMLGHGCDGSQYPQFYDRIKNMYQMLLWPYVGSYSGRKCRQIFKEPCNI